MDIALDLVKAFPKLTKTGTLMASPQPEWEIMNLLIITWKGTQSKFLQMLIDMAKTHQEKYKQYNTIFSQVNLLYVTSRLPDAGQVEFNNWFPEKYVKTGSNATHLEILQDYAVNVWPKMSKSARKRSQRRPEVSETQRVAYLAKIKAMGCDEKDFWPVIPENEYQEGQAGINAIQAQGTDARPKKNVNKWLTEAENIVKLVVKNLNANPQVCKNCFLQHPLKDCSRIEANARANLAAWMVEDYETQTNRGRNPFLKESAAKLKMSDST
ncbi:hypothetical protein JCM33374_g38 [Metschnikowia sp. JCM 33374]|nr:hypothetical protein JCM33374_g38 [Metschnikowia sp. JCM 33374]